MKRKILLATFTFVTLFACAFGLSACGGEHTHSYTSEVTTAATCTTDGVMTYTCSCGDSYTEAIPATGHTSVSANNVVAATCTAAGKESDTVCSVCGETLSTGAAIPALGHTYAESWTYDETDHWHAATCEHTDEVSGKAAHNFKNGVCTVCGYNNVTVEKTAGTEGLEYELSDDGTHYICTGLGTVTETEIEIASWYHEKWVTEIGDSAFWGCDSLTSIVIPDSVTSIGSYAFYWCPSLTSIVIPDSVTAIGRVAFRGCTSLTSVTIGNGVTKIGGSAFYNCTALTSIVIPDSVTKIGDHAFDGCSSLTSITIPDSVTSIGDYAFSNCSSLTYKEDDNAYYLGNESNPYVVLVDTMSTDITSCTINEKTKFIHSSAFLWCSSLTSITIPDSVTEIGGSAFAYCSSLTSITIPDSVTSIGSSAFYGCYSLTYKEDDNAYYLGNESNPYVVLVYAESNDITSCMINEKTKVIYGSAFQYCSSLTSITIPDSVTSIGSYAFYWCYSLTNITIPDSVTSIGDGAFKNCSSLTSVTIPNSVTSIGNSAFYGCSSLTSVTIGNGVTEIGDEAFEYCTALTSITIPDSVTSIGSLAFHRCMKLVEVYNLSSLNITAGSEDNGRVAYYAKNVYTADSGASKLTTTGDGYVFYDDTENNNGYYLISYTGTETALTLPANFNGSNYSIYWYAFYQCDSLTSIVIPDGVTSIGGGAFWGCDSLTSVTIGNGVTSIGDDAFYGCTSLKSVTIGNGVTSIGNSAFYNCASLTSITVDGNNRYYKSIDGNLYSKDGATLIQYAIGKTNASFTIGNGVTEIGDEAFSGCSSLTSITIPNSVTSIGSYAFYYCDSLTSITIPNSVTSIGSYAFYYCDSLTSVYITDITAWCGIKFSGNYSNPLYYAHNLYLNGELVTDLVIPDSVTSIGNYAFSRCTSLTSVTIGNGVTEIGDSAFEDCSSLTSIVIPNSVTSIGSYAFDGCSSLEYNWYDNAYYLGNESNPYVVLVRAARWNFTSCTINENTKIIYSDAFYDCSSLTSVTIGNGVTSIGDYAFYYCTSLTSITIPNSVTSIGNSAFHGCSSLTNVTIGNGVTEIGDDAFYNCSSLTSVTIGNGVTEIGDWVFAWCDSLTSIVIPDSVIEIGGYAFYECSSLTSITIPDGVTSIGYYAFSGCTSLTSVTFENTSGWRYADDSGATSGTSILSADLADPATAATYLTSTYYKYCWKRS